MVKLFKCAYHLYSCDHRYSGYLQSQENKFGEFITSIESTFTTIAVLMLVPEYTLSILNT